MSPPILTTSHARSPLEIVTTHPSPIALTRAEVEKILRSSSPLRVKSSGSINLASTSALGFLSFPPEIRNRIYSLTLQHGRRIFIGKHGQTIRGKHRLDRDHADKACGWSGNAYRVKIHKQLNVRVLLANKQVNGEATPILYGGNEFIFGDYMRLHTWAQQVGMSFQQLRVIEIYADNLSRFVSGMPTFPFRAEALRLLVLSVDACKLDDHRGSAKMLSRFMRVRSKKVTQGRGKQEEGGCEVVLAETPTSRMLRKLYQSKTHSRGYPELEQVVKFGNRVGKELERLLWVDK